MNASRIFSPAACLVIPLLTALLAGCATGFDFKPVESVPFRERAVTQVQDGVRVTAAVPDAKETRELFGLSLYKKRVQPVWIEIENMTDEPLGFLPLSVDADYHTPLEVASLTRSSKKRKEAEQQLFHNSVNLWIAPGQVRSGFIFTNADEGTKAFNVDLFNFETNWAFTFFIPVPGLAVDHYDVDFHAIYPEDEITHFTEAEDFIAALEQLPCCVVDSNGSNTGDPLNIVIVGEPQDIYYAVIRAGWDETETVTAASGWKTAASFFTGGAYRYSPVSSLYLFGRKQDVALQRIRENIHERNHFRLWLAPMTFRGHTVWIGQISRDIGVRFTTRTITTHKIDPDVDETREFLVENFAYNEVLEKFAYVRGVGAAPIDEPRQNLTGDPFFTDGLRVVLWISSELTDLDDIEYVDWVSPRR
ncbi:MAG TPA: LssY C-terminal domain-containing protein [Woeseiaceae bacterium]|nr:LssY C-terminal domain-containing protein [Woeseiaceae bacterium]